jgi:membrane-associated phospholipid phosphatase
MGRVSFRPGGSCTVSVADYIVNLFISVVLIVGAYQFYFLCQRLTRSRTRTLSLKFEDNIKLRPAWIWVYSGFYYPVILVVNLGVRDMRHFSYIAFSYMILLASQMLCFLLMPLAVPTHWRPRERIHGPSGWMLALVQRYDDRSNCFPSMHVSVATLTSLHLYQANPEYVVWIVLFPILIAVSAIWTKQHYLIDLFPGALLGYFVFLLVRRFMY